MLTLWIVNVIVYYKKYIEFAMHTCNKCFLTSWQKWQSVKMAPRSLFYICYV